MGVFMTHSEETVKCGSGCVCVIDLGKADIEEFQKKNPCILHSYAKIYTKVFNEQKTVKLRAEKRQLDMQKY